MKTKKYIITIIVLLLTLSLMPSYIYASEIIITDHTTSSYTKKQIRSKKKELSAVDTSDIYEEEPSITSPYSAGSLTQQVKDNTLNQINYYRFLIGLDSVTLNETYMGYSQKGAVILAANNQLTHFPTQPSDMDDEFYQQGYLATSCGIGYSANCSQGYLTLWSSIRGFVDDTGNVSGGVGHRLSMLDPKASSISFGYASRYSVVNVFNNSNTNTDKYYAWPSAGYFRTDAMVTSAQWSFDYSTSGLTAKDVYVKLTANGETYESGEDFTINKEASRRAYYYTIPTALKTYLTDGGSSFVNGKSVDVEVGGFTDSSGNTYIYKYTINFYLDLIGDVNEDGQVNVKDWNRLYSHINKTELLTGQGLINADVNEDGKVNIKDWNRLYSHINKTQLLF